MTVATTTTWNPALQHIIQQALLNVGAIDENEPAGSPAYYAALRSLNGLVKTMEATGLHVWTEEEYILFLQSNVARYVLGQAASADYSAFPAARVARADAWTLLTLLNPAAVAATAITVEDATGAVVGGHLGVIDNDGAIQWVTITAIAGDLITFTAQPLLVAADAGNFAPTYLQTQGRVLKAPNARLLTFQDTSPGNYNETPMTILSRQEYMDLPNKNSPGTPTQWFYSPQREVGLFYVWPVANQVAWAVRFTGYRSLADFLTPENTSDMPQEWVLPLIWNLSKEIATAYGVDEGTWNRIEKMADNYALLVISYDRESEPISFGMDYWAYGD